MSDKTELPIELKSVSKQSDLKRGDVFLWRSGMSGRYEIHTFHSDSGYGAKTFTQYKEEDGSSEIVNWSGICGILVSKEVKILVDDGKVFDGNREQFMDCFFSNANNEEIKSWCLENKFSLKIDGEIIL